MYVHTAVPMFSMMASLCAPTSTVTQVPHKQPAQQLNPHLQKLKSCSDRFSLFQFCPRCTLIAASEAAVTAKPTHAPHET
jgi:hypothetical protein